MVTNASGTTIEEESDYYPWGRERVITDTLPDQDYKFTGKERDTESGLDFFIARHYSSGLGRFLQPDEFTGGPVDAFSSSDPLPPGPLPYADITNPQSLNKYTYTYNNPLRYTDPDGHCPQCNAYQQLWQQVKDYVHPSDSAQVAIGIGKQMLNNFLAEGEEFIQPTNAMQRAGTDFMQDSFGPAAEKVALFLPLGKGGKSVGVQANRAAGLRFEGQVLKSEGLSKNTNPMQVADPKTNKPGATIPDAIRPSGQTVDAKAGKRISDSSQLRRQSEASRQAGQKAQVIVKKGTQVSATVRKRMDVKEY